MWLVAALGDCATKRSEALGEFPVRMRQDSRTPRRCGMALRAFGVAKRFGVGTPVPLWGWGSTHHLGRHGPNTLGSAGEVLFGERGPQRIRLGIAKPKMQMTPPTFRMLKATRHPPHRPR